MTIPNLSTTPAQARLEEQALTIQPRGKEAQRLSWEDILGYTCYEELLLYSLKISLRGDKTLSIIRFKWHDKTGFQSLKCGRQSKE